MGALFSRTLGWSTGAGKRVSLKGWDAVLSFRAARDPLRDGRHC